MKILIIKLGYSETFVQDDSAMIVSLGDVLRTTPILEALVKKYKSAEIYWLTSKEAKVLVQNNKFLKKTFIYNSFDDSFNINEYFDIIINLEKFDEIFEFINSLRYKEILGFIKSSNKLDLNPKNDAILSYIKSGDNSRVWQELIFEMLDLKWNLEPYSLGYKPTSKSSFKVGLNYLVGSKWPQKAMSMEKWNSLSKSLENLDIKYSWQEGKENLKDYIEWIQSCNIIITQDSLGMHIAMALNKKIIALFGVTNKDEVHPYGKISFICIKCGLETMDDIKINDIIKLLG